ncbi:MAG: hypothetical protein IJS65_06210 [Clostridia bacterium]|nr:hypothetical protein [Clostridia bacterium]
MIKLKRINWFYLFLSFVISLLLWFFVISELNPVTEVSFHNLDIQIVNADQLNNNGLMIVNGGNNTATVKVRGNRDKIALVKKGKFTLTASVASITAPGTYNLNYSVSVDVPDISVISENPSQVTVVVDRVASKSLTIDTDITGSLKNDYVLESLKLSNDAVLITGAQTAVDEVAKIKVEYNISDLYESRNVTLPIVLLDENGKELDPDNLAFDIQSVLLSVNIKQRKTVPVKVNFISSENFSEDMLVCTIEPSEITVLGEHSEVDSYNALVLGSVNIKSFITNKLENIEYDIVLPNGLTAETEYQKAKVTITAPDYSRKTVTVPSSYFKPSSEYKFSQSTSVTVDVFGPKDLIQTLDSRDFNIEIAYVKEGSSINKKTAYLDVSCTLSDIVVLGTYTVPVSVK